MYQGQDLSSMTEACNCLSLEQSGRNEGSLWKDKCSYSTESLCFVGLTLVENELDIMSLTVETTLVFSAAYEPGPEQSMAN